MTDKMNIKEKFVKDMGLEECDFIDPISSKKSQASMKGKCKNSYEDEFDCKVLIDTERGFITKSECEKLGKEH